MDAGVVYRGDTPRFIISVYLDRVPDELPDGLPGYTAAYATAGKLTRACWDVMT
jgi:beta-lactamase class A